VELQGESILRIYHLGRIRISVGWLVDIVVISNGRLVAIEGKGTLAFSRCQFSVFISLSYIFLGSYLKSAVFGLILAP
jgi:hypothetical protein